MERILLVQCVGRVLINSIFARDITVIQAIVMVVATMVLLLNLAVDLMYDWADPRIRYAQLICLPKGAGSVAVLRTEKLRGESACD